jgi:hypothetical protein
MGGRESTKKRVPGILFPILAAFGQGPAIERRPYGGSLETDRKAPPATRKQRAATCRKRRERKRLARVRRVRGQNQRTGN